MPIAQITTVQSKATTRKAVQRRSKGELTREKILLSAINVLAFNGIKGTTHRAIANHAEIQLSLTTYYFKDISDLVQNAFQLNSEYLRSRTDTILSKAFTILESVDKASLKKVSVKSELCEQFAEMTAKFLFENIKTEAVFLAVEQLMFTTLKVSPELKLLAHEHELSQLEPFTKLAQYFNKKDPEVDAQMMRTIFSQLQYSQLDKAQSDLSIEPIRKVTKKLLTWIMGLKS
jgi:DNA-binding transcriptional regulator YbjK